MLSERYNEIITSLEKGMNTDKKKIDSWKAVGKNYKLKKNGQPYADAAKTFEGVDGIKEVKKYKVYKINALHLYNAAGYSIEITGLTIPEIEEKIQKEIETAKNSLEHYENLLKYIDASIEKCDEIAKAYFEIFSGKEMDQDLFSAHKIIRDYLKRIIDDWEDEQYLKAQSKK